MKCVSEVGLKCKAFTNLLNKNFLTFIFASGFPFLLDKITTTYELSFTSEMRPLTPPRARTELSLRFTQPRDPVTGSHFRLQLRNELHSRQKLKVYPLRNRSRSIFAPLRELNSASRGGRAQIDETFNSARVFL